MTENENVASNEEAQNEPVPNPYNQRKSWHTDDVMPKTSQTAESLFVDPNRQVIKEDEEGEQPEPEQKATPYKQPNYKKRYDD